MQDKFLATLTVQEFANALADCGYIITKRPEEPKHQEAPAELDFSDSSRYGCGLRAIMTRYNVKSTRTAQKLKDGVLAPAIYQAERRGKFWIDYQIADAIMKERKAKKETNAQTVTA